MQTVSDSVKELVAQYAKVELTAYINGQKVEGGIGSCEFAPSCGDSETFSFGNACATSVSLTLATPMPDIKDKQLRITWAVDETEHPLFDGKIANAVVTAGHTAVEAWDAMYYGGSDAFVPTQALQGDIGAADAFSLIAGFMGVTASGEALELLSGITVSSGLGHLAEENSNSAAAGFIAGLVGGNAMIDRAGYLTVRSITEVDFETEPYAGGASAQNEDYFVTGITMQREELVTIRNEDGTAAEQEQLQEFLSGDGTLMVSNPLADQNAADRAYEALGSISFRPGDYSFPGGLLLEPGDVFTIHSMDGSYRVAAIKLSMSFDGGVKTSVSCGGKAVEGGAQGSINQALATLFADFARLRTLVAENAEIVSAKISHLSAEDIVAGRISSTDFATMELQELYPASDLYPEKAIFPNNGEQIIRGFEIDFSTGIIRGVFWSEAIEALTSRIEALEQSYSDIQERLSKLEDSLLYPKSVIVLQESSEEEI